MKIINHKIIILLFFNIYLVNSQFITTSLLNVIKNKLLKLRNPVILCKLSEKFASDLHKGYSDTFYIKSDMNHLRSSNFNGSGAIICLEDFLDSDAQQIFSKYSQNAVLHPWLVIESGKKKLNDLVTNIEINKKVFTWNIETMELREVYNINKFLISNKLAMLYPCVNNNREVDNDDFYLNTSNDNVMIDGNNNALITNKNNDSQLCWRKCYTEEFLSRRSNFYGLELKGLTEYQIPYTLFHLDQISKLIEESKEKEMISIAGVEKWGSFPDILKVLQSSLNFTTDTYIRRDRGWGSPLGHGNWTG